jgi:sialic acid synthase SpsE
MQLIAETAWHHEGDCAFMTSLIDALIERGAQDIIKCHVTLDLDAYMVPDHPGYETLSQWMLEKGQWMEILGQIQASDKGLMCLCNDVAAVDLAQGFEPALFEVHATNLNNVNLLDSMRAGLEPSQKIVIGVGGSTLEEIDCAIRRLKTDRIVLMFGFQNYPTRYDRINLARMRRVVKLYPEFTFGYADHCSFDEPENLLVTLLGAAQGCSYVEKHVTTQMGQKRCDFEAAISIEMLNALKPQLAIIEACNGDGALALSSQEREYGRMGLMKAIAIATRDIGKGESLQEDMLRFVRTSQTSDLSQEAVVHRLGTTLCAEIQAGTPFLDEHFSD